MRLYLSFFAFAIFLSCQASAHEGPVGAMIHALSAVEKLALTMRVPVGLVDDLQAVELFGNPESNSYRIEMRSSEAILELSMTNIYFDPRWMTTPQKAPHVQTFNVLSAGEGKNGLVSERLSSNQLYHILIYLQQNENLAELRLIKVYADKSSPHSKAIIVDVGDASGSRLLKLEYNKESEEVTRLE